MNKLLLVEDNVDLREGLALTLEEAGYQVLQAGNGAEGLELLKRARVLPDLMVADLLMPVMDGPELFRLMNADPRLRSIPVIVMSAKSDAMAEVRESCVGYLQKPFDLDDLFSLIAQHGEPPSLSP